MLEEDEQETAPTQEQATPPGESGPVPDDEVQLPGDRAT
jgi:hypothetical protein